MPYPIATTRSSSSRSTALSSAARTSSSDVSGVSNSCRTWIVPSRSTSAARVEVPPRSTPITKGAPTARATIAPRMAVGESPTGGIAAAGSRAGSPRADEAAGREPDRSSAPQRPRRWGRWALLGVGALVILFLVWGLLGYLSFSRGVSDANDRLHRARRTSSAKLDGSLLTTPSTTLVIGTDGGSAPGRKGARRSDSLMLLHTDPDTHRLSYLSIPRDLRVEIWLRLREDQRGEPVRRAALTLATVRNLTGLPIHHVVVVDFDGFKDLIDALGGIDITVPKPILSNKFDCPYPPARCSSWDGWRFGKGKRHMDGRRALVYSRIRTNQLDPSESTTRTTRQQAVAEAVGDKIASFGTFVKLPFMGDSLASPLATDLSAWQLGQLGWVRFRPASRSAAASAASRRRSAASP